MELVTIFIVVAVALLAMAGAVVRHCFLLEEREEVDEGVGGDVQVKSGVP